MALVGCGHWGRNLARCLHTLGVLGAVCDADRERAREVGAPHGVPAREFDSLLADPAIDAFAIATSVPSHAPLASRVLESGRPVFVEKPLAYEIEEARALRDLATRRGTLLMVGHLLRYHPAFTRLQALLAEGALGELRYVYSTRLSFGRVRTQENALWSFAPHDVSMVLALMGGPPRRVMATGGAYLQREIADITTTHLEFDGGRRAHVFVSWLHPYKDHRLVVIGERAMAEFNDGRDWHEKLAVYEHAVCWTGGLPALERAAARPIDLDPTEPLLAEMRHFVDCVERDAPPLTDGAEGIAVLQILDAAQRSLSAEGTWLPFSAMD